MKSKFRKFLFIGLLAAVTACGNDNDDDDDDNQVNNPVSTPAPTATPSAVFKWASVRFDHREDTVTPPPPGTCGGFTRFEIRANGNYKWHNPCDAGNDKSGSLTANELGALDAQMNGVSRAEASAKESCVEFNDNFARSDQRISMRSTENRRYSLYRQDDDRECVSGNPVEVTAIRNTIYQLKTKYTQ